MKHPFLNRIYKQLFSNESMEMNQVPTYVLRERNGKYTKVNITDYSFNTPYGFTN